MSLRLVRQIAVKVIVTHHLKERLALEMQAALQRIDNELQQLELQARSMSTSTVATVREQYDARLQERRETRRDLLERIKAVASLEVGQEHTHSMVDCLVEVEVGDDWNRVTAKEIVLKDDRVVEIR